MSSRHDDNDPGKFSWVVTNYKATIEVGILIGQLLLPPREYKLVSSPSFIIKLLLSHGLRITLSQIVGEK